MLRGSARAIALSTRQTKINASMVTHNLNPTSEHQLFLKLFISNAGGL